MAQDAFQVDQLQIEPAAAGTRTISRDSTAGALKFVDAVETAGLLLSQLAGLQNITGVLVVGRAGSGAQYTAIATAIAAVSGATAAAPTIILILPGTYTENLVIDEDGICLVGLGRVVLTPSTTTSPTVTIQAGGGIPLLTLLQGLRIEHPTAGEDCIYAVGGASSTVANNGIFIEDCELVASGAGGYNIRASAVNNIRVLGGTWEGSSSTAICSIANCSTFFLERVAEVVDLQLAYDTGNARPSVTTCEYKVIGCSQVGASTNDLDGAGSLLYADCPSVGAITIGGDRSLALVNSRVGNLTLNETVACTRIGGARGTLTGDGTMTESGVMGVKAFSSSTSEAVAFDADMPDTSYAVHLDWESTSITAAVTTRATTGFTIGTSGSYTGNVSYTVTRQIS